VYVVIKYSLFGMGRLMELRKKHQYIFRAVVTEEKFAQSECYKINRKHFLSKNQ